MTAKLKPIKIEKPAKEKGPLGPFDFLTSINEGAGFGPDLLSGSRACSAAGLDLASDDRGYVSFIINRGLSYFPDTILFANEMNQHASLPVVMQYKFLKGLIRRRKRFSKWGKKADDTDDVALIKKEYKVNTERAHSYLKLYTLEQLEMLRKKHNKGGVFASKK